jgi:Tfp pilus assembly PilM family ATPase
MLLNLQQYLSSQLNMQVLVGDPFNRISYFNELKPVIREISPKLAVAAGLALREVEA